MATAIAKLESELSHVKSGRRSRYAPRVYNLPAAPARRSLVKRIAVPSLFAMLALFLCALVGFGYFYSHYAAVVDQRIKTGFWFSRGGVYAAPIRVRVGQKASPAVVTELLQRGGYVAGDEPDAIFNGSYTHEGNKLKIKSNTSYNRQTRTAEITFAGNKVATITEDSRNAEEFLIEPEMLTGRSETKRAANHALKFEDIPVNLRNAILAAEDQRFFSHYGIDPKGIGRAFLRNFNESEIKQGGSTITQQLVKNTFLSPERSYTRKFAEAFLAIALERRMSKEQIFALYCNEIYLGQYGSTGVHGVEQAAKTYFGKELDELDLNEAAAIAAMIKNPKRYAPHRDGDLARERRQWIVRRMAEIGLATGDAVTDATSSELALAPPPKKGNLIAPYFIDAAAKELEAKYPGDYQNTNFNTRVYTTIDTHLQTIAEKAVTSQLAKLDKGFAKRGLRPQAALVALDPQTGHVLAMVGGRDYTESQFNRVTEALRQPGSTFKPFVYATALERGYTEISLYNDSPTEFTMSDGKQYKPANYGDAYAGHNITMKTALVKSSNIAAIRSALESGLENVAETAENFGFHDVRAYPSMALGVSEVTPLQLAAAYAVFANGGRRVEPTFINRIISGEEKNLYVSAPSNRQLIKEQTAYMVTDMLRGVVERGTAQSAKGALGDDVFAGKTGSSKDGWFVGYTPNLVTVAWVGFDENQDIGGTGGEVALPMWTEFMRGVVQTRPEYGGEQFPMPKGLVNAVVDPETGMLADGHCPLSEKVVVPARFAPSVRCLLHQPKIDTMLAADVTSDMPPEVSVTEIPSEGTVVETTSAPEHQPQYTESPGSKEMNPPAGKPPRPINETYFVEYTRGEGKSSN